jgi:transcriptional regulator with PAS, ATPase and Fis domain
MKSDMNDLKKLVLEIMQKGVVDTNLQENNAHIIQKLYEEEPKVFHKEDASKPAFDHTRRLDEDIQDTEEVIEESLSLEGKEKELILKALLRHKGKRKFAAQELGISERTLYRKIKEYSLNEL